ncbi:nucleotidyltransferase family protein [Halobacillus amylolyticus]|uniref:Nucleotidyltransferase domain-containing protein n=1 Tax=Halobacillus amylolyticus TaxID=2932259 RepID=A0ABY4H8L9_9BACI|nr:nucleotidyltransferase domain-containing protein [Halobacillus amylolyticus]UOR10954.1 nucleotidyltransferase domain-containing protein [Halobacillus amylolyticus]
MYGLLERDLDYMMQAFKSLTEIETVRLFGSRAMGNYKKGSDIDLAVFWAHVTSRTIFKLTELLEEVYPLPYFFDIVHYESITNAKFKECIDQQGVDLFKRV